MKKLLKRIACIFFKHDFVYQYHKTNYHTSKISTRYFVYHCNKCGKYKSRKIKF